jgi:hypothetical protein
MDNSIVAAILGIGGSLIGSLVGGWMTRSASIRATNKAFELNRTLHTRQRLENLRRVLLGINTELTVAFENYTAAYGPMIDAHKPGAAFNYKYPIDDSGFVFYQTNNAALGDLADDDLRELIIKCYLQTQVILNTHRMNNDLMESVERYSTLAEGHSENLRALVAEKQAALDVYGDAIVMNYRVAAELVTNTLPGIEKAVNSIESKLSRV